MTSTAATAARRTPPDGRAAWHRPLLALDAVACAAIGVVLTVAPATLVDGVGIATATPVRLLGAGFLLAAVVNGWAARAEGRLQTHLAVDLDVACVIVLTTVLVAGPGGAAGWVQALLVAGIVVPLAMAAAKVVGLRGSTGPGDTT